MDDANLDKTRRELLFFSFIHGFSQWSQGCAAIAFPFMARYQYGTKGYLITVFACLLLLLLTEAVHTVAFRQDKDIGNYRRPFRYFTYIYWLVLGVAFSLYISDLFRGMGLPVWGTVKPYAVGTFVWAHVIGFLGTLCVYLYQRRRLHTFPVSPPPQKKTA